MNNSTKFKSTCSCVEYPKKKLQEKRKGLEKNGDAKRKLIISAGNLHLNERMMHYFLANVIVPKATNQSQLTKFEFKLLYVLKYNVVVNQSYVVKKITCSRLELRQKVFHMQGK